MLVALMCAAFTGTAWAADETITFSSLYSSNTILDEFEIKGTDFSVTFNKRSGGTSTQYYTNGTAVRWYGGGTLVVASTTKSIEKIEVTFTQTANSVSANVGSYSLSNSVGTWTGSASSVTLTQSGTSGHCRVSSIAVTYAASSKEASDLTITSSTTVNLTITSEVAHPTSTVTYTSSSTGAYTWTTTDTSVATVADGVITAQGAGTATIKVSQAADDDYEASDEKEITVNVTDNSRVASDLALTGAPVALAFDLYNKSAAQVINYTTSGTGEVTVSTSEYISVSVDENAKTITVTPLKKTASAQTITVSQAQDSGHAAGSVTFTVTIDDSTPITEETIDFTAQGWTNAADITSASGSAASVSFAKNTGSNAPKYYTGGARLYANNLFTIESTKTIESVVFTFADNNTKLALSDGQAGTLGDVTTSSPYTATWTGSATSLQFYANGGQARIKSITITYADDSKAKKPTLTAETSFFGTMQVEMSSAEDGAVIYYTTNGTTPTAESTPYSEAITINATTTVKAIAVAGGKTSDVVSATYTLITPLTVAEALATADDTEVYVSGIISRVGSYNSTYNSITYFISDDGSETSELEIYSGKGIDGASFSAITDLEFGDRVVVHGTLTTYGSVKETKQNSTIVSYTAKPASDIAKTGDITLDFKGGDTMAEVTDYFTSSSTGAYTYTVADETVVEAVDELISALKVGTTTVTVSQAATLAYKAGEIVINITVQDTRVAATTIPAINISELTDDAENGTIAVVGAEKADAGVTFTFTSSNEDVLYIDGTTYTVGDPGTTEITVTATASDATQYTDVEAVFTVTVNAAVKGDNTIAVVFDSYSTAYGTALEGIATGSTGFDGTITAVSSNPAVATISIVDGEVTVTPVAVGTTTVTFSAAETGKFNAAEDVEKEFTVTAPAATNEAPASTPASAIFTETFDQCDGTGGNDDKWSGSIATGTPTYDNTGWTLTGGKANQCVKLNKGATLVSPNINVQGATSLVLTFKVAGWGSEEGDLSISLDDEDAVLSSDAEAFTGSEWSNHTVTISSISASTIQITFTAPSSKRCFIDEVVLTKPATSYTESVTLNASGYLAYASEYPLNFTNSLADGYSAWKVTGVSGSNIISERVTGAVTGGEGVLLKGDANAEISIPSVDCSTALDGNLLKATLAPTYFADETIYALSGDAFYLNSPCTLKANRAYLPASVLNVGSVKSFTFVFEDNATGITETRQATPEEAEAIFNLAGQRINKMQRGVNIVNGRKVLVK